MPPEAKIHLIEDDADCRMMAEIHLTGAGHRILGVSTTLTEARAAISGFTEQGIEVVVMDGDLTGRGNISRDGEILTALINKDHPQIGVVGYATNRDVVGADIQSPKVKGGPSLVRAVTDIAYPIQRPPRG
jgi:DNA-binding NtrC family response regulator